MKILMLKDYFFPEKCAGITLANDLVSGFSERGYDVVVYTPIPCRGIDDSTKQEYKRRKKEYYNGAIIYRYWLPYEAANTILRVFRYILQNLIQLIKGLICKCDIVFLGSTPPTMGLVGVILKKIKKIPFVYNLQDIFPDSLINAGMTCEGSFLWRIGSIIEKCTYNHADKIIVISEDFKKNILKKGVPEEKIEVIYNWVDTQQIRPVPRNKNKLINELQLDASKFIVVYAGNFGISQGADIIIDAAELLVGETQIQFVIFGGGPEFRESKRKIEEKKLTNIIIKDLLPTDRIAEVYSLGNVSLITCKSGVGTSGMPSKTWSIMACDTPIIASFDLNSELAEIIKKADAGICIAPGNAEQLAGEILNYRNRNVCRTNARIYVEQNASRNKCVERYVEVIKMYEGNKNK